MKTISMKIANVIKYIIGISFAVCLFAGGLGVIGFIVALILGGDSAVAICTWLTKTYYAYLIKLSTITTILCFVLAYFDGSAKWVNPFKKKEK